MKSKLLASLIGLAVLLIAKPSYAASLYVLPLNTSGGVSSLFDHSSPDYTSNSNFTRYDGTTYTGSASTGAGCTQGQGCYDGHNGIDYTASTGTDVYAAATGSVKTVGWQNPNDHTEGFGFYIRLWHSTTSQSTVYGHLTENSQSAGVSVNSSITQGSVIAKSGNTGNSSGPHLHFSVFNGDTSSSGSSIDPYGWSGAGNDPWTIDQGYLWTTNPPSHTTTGYPTGGISYPSVNQQVITGPVTITGTSGAVNTTVTMIQLLLDGAVLSTITPNSTTNWSVWFNPAGYAYNTVHTLTLHVRDSNNTEYVWPRTFIYSTIPSGSFTNPASNGLGIAQTTTITGTASDAGTSLTLAQLLVDGSLVATMNPAVSTWSYSFNPAGYSWGLHTFSLLLRNANGVENTSVTRTFYHTSVPVGSITSPSADYTTLYGPITVTGTSGDVGTTVSLIELKVDNVLLSTITPSSTTSWSVWFNPAGYSPGTHKFTLHVRDANSMDGLWDRFFTLPSGPFGSFSNPATNGTTLSAPITLTGTAGDFSANLTVQQLFLDGSLINTFSPPTSSWSKWVTLAGYPTGTHTFTLYLRDANMTEQWVTRTVNYQP